MIFSGRGHNMGNIVVNLGIIFLKEKADLGSGL